MVYFSEHFYWLPAVDEAYGESISLDINDGWKIHLSMDNCKSAYMDCKCEPECGYGEYCNRRIEIEELIALRDAMTAAIDYYHGQPRNKGN